MKRFIFYYNTEGLPQSFTEAAFNRVINSLRETGVVQEADKLAVIGVTVGDTRLELIADDPSPEEYSDMMRKFGIELNN